MAFCCLMRWLEPRKSRVEPRFDTWLRRKLQNIFRAVLRNGFLVQYVNSTGPIIQLSANHECRIWQRCNLLWQRVIDPNALQWHECQILCHGTLSVGHYNH